MLNDHLLAQQTGLGGLAELIGWCIVAIVTVGVLTCVALWYVAITRPKWRLAAGFTTLALFVAGMIWLWGPVYHAWALAFAPGAVISIGFTIWGIVTALIRIQKKHDRSP